MAEFGRQEMVPGFKANSSHVGMGSTRYVIVAMTAQNQAQLATDANSSTILGVAQNDPNVGEAFSIAYGGLSKIVAGASANAGDIITTNASGRAIKVTSGAMALGRFLEAPGADGDVVTAMLFHPVRWGQVA